MASELATVEEAADAELIAQQQKAKLDSWECFLIAFRTDESAVTETSAKTIAEELEASIQTNNLAESAAHSRAVQVEPATAPTPPASTTPTLDNVGRCEGAKNINQLVIVYIRERRKLTGVFLL